MLLKIDLSTKQEYSQPEKLSFQLTNWRIHFILQFHITEESISQLSFTEIFVIWFEFV